MPMHSQHDALFQIRHDTLIFAEMLLFLRLRQDSFISAEPPCFDSRTKLVFSPRCHLLLHNDIFVCTEMPFFRRFTILPYLHELLSLAKR